MSVDTELYFSAIREVLGSVTTRDPGDYEHVTDTGILLQVYAENGYAERSDVTDSIKAVFVASLEKYFGETGSFPVIDGAVQFLEAVRRSRDTGVAIATGGWRDSALMKLKRAGFKIDGVPVVTSDDSPTRTGIMRLAYRKAGGLAGAVTYFGDAEWDRRACRDLGWNFVAVGRRLNGIESYEGLEWKFGDEA